MDIQVLLSSTEIGKKDNISLQNENIYQWLRFGDIISEDEERTIQTGYVGSKEVILKSSFFTECLIYEYIIGAYVNTLKPYTNNFIQTYGIFYMYINNRLRVYIPFG